MSEIPLPPPGAAPPPSTYSGSPSHPAMPVYPGSGMQPYAPQQLGPAPGYAYAGFGTRFLGYLVDSVLLIAGFAALYVPIVVLPLVRYYQAHPVTRGQTFTVPADLQPRVYAITVIAAAFSALYYGGLVALVGRTLGQRALGMRVVRAEDGGKLPAGRSFLRASIFWGPGLLGLVPFIGWAFQVLAFVGLLAVAWEPRKQGWHDRLGRSVVVTRVPVAPGVLVSAAGTPR